jgi:hypothetical protein
MARIAPVKTPAHAAANYVANGGAPAAANNWATNLALDLPAVFAAAAKQVGFWSSQVSTVEAQNNYVNGLNKAAANTAPIIAKINGPAKGTYTAQVRAAGGPGGRYLAFANQWMPAVATERANLDRTNPRGDRAANRARQAVYDTWVDTQAGKFRQ